MNTTSSLNHSYTITVAGAGYVGLSNAVLLAQRHKVKLFDIDEKRIEKLQQRESPVDDSQLASFLQNKKLDLLATTDKVTAYENADYVIIATPTNYDHRTNYFDTKSVDASIDAALSYAPNALIVIKSTIPVGYVQKMRAERRTNNILFSPEFLREGRAVHDNLFPSRIVLGEKSDRAAAFANMLASCALKSDVPIFLTGPTEAEAIKLFANTYLAMRVAYFNELDTFAETHGLSAHEIIRGVCSDPRVGDHYNNPSFGYGGYCLPKDSKQLLANYEDIPQRLISAIVDSNKTRKTFVAQKIIQLQPTVVGIYRLAMKLNSDNFRDTSVLDIIDELIANNQKVIIYEPQLSENHFRGATVINDLRHFKQDCSVILANRYADEILDVKEKIYTRDIFGRD
jgi:UDPglucose 6-dehydrogenase